MTFNSKQCKVCNNVKITEYKFSEKVSDQKKLCLILHKKSYFLFCIYLVLRNYYMTMPLKSAVKTYIRIIFLCIIRAFEGNRVTHSGIRNVV